VCIGYYAALGLLRITSTCWLAVGVDQLSHMQ